MADYDSKSFLLLTREKLKRIYEPGGRHENALPMYRDYQVSVLDALIGHVQRGAAPEDINEIPTRWRKRLVEAMEKAVNAQDPDILINQVYGLCLNRFW